MEERSERAAAPAGGAGRGRPLVEILSFAGCPNHLGAIELVERLSREASTSVIAGWRTRSAFGRASSTRRRTVPVIGHTS